MGEGSDRPLTVITGDRKTRERRAGRRRALDQNEQITPNCRRAFDIGPRVRCDPSGARQQDVS